jgi:hypothetical protein
MSWVVANIHRIMIVSGLLTMTMIYAALAPETALRSTFGESMSGPVADIVVRNWGALIALVGATLIYAARKPAVRPLALTVSGASKAVFIALVLSHGGRFLGYQAGIAIFVDALRKRAVDFRFERRQRDGADSQHRVVKRLDRELVSEPGFDLLPQLDNLQLTNHVGARLPRIWSASSAVSVVVVSTRLGASDYGHVQAWTPGAS